MLNTRPAPSRLHALIFDKDGLMLDTETLSQRAWRMADEQHGHDLSESVYINLIGHGRIEVMRLLEEAVGCSVSAQKLLSSHNTYFSAMRNTEGIRVKDGLVPLLDELKRRKIPLAVATSSEQPHAFSHLEMTGLLDYFDVVVTGDMVAMGKPSPDIFLEASSRLGVAPPHCLVLEDSEAGVRAAYAAGIHVIQIPDKKDATDLSRSMVHAVCRNLDEAASFILPWLDQAPDAGQDLHIK